MYRYKNPRRLYYRKRSLPTNARIKRFFVPNERIRKTNSGRVRYLTKIEETVSLPDERAKFVICKMYDGQQPVKGERKMFETDWTNARNAIFINSRPLMDLLSLDW